MKKTSLIAGLLLGATLVSGNILSRLPAKNSTLATSASTSAPASVTVSNACSLSADTTSSGNSAHSATLSPGTYTTDIGQTTITISCNDINGWALYAIGNGEGTNKTDLVHSSNSSFIIPTGTATSGSLSNWSMKLSGTGTNQDASGPIISPYNSYSVVPSTNTKVASLDRNSASSGGSSVMTTYAAYISSDQIAGTYSGAVKYTLAHPHTNIVCDDGYENINGSCIILYMQDVATWGDTLLPNSGDSVQAIDSRDNKKYWVTRLADGNIWMTQNLDLDIDSTKTYTSADTNLSSNWTPSTSTYTTGATTWNSSATAPESYDPGDVCWNGNLNTNWNGTLATETVTCTSSNMNYHIGNYYNWTAAVAMNNSSSYTTNGTVVTQSICPKGWTLPLSGNNTSSGSFYNLLNQYGLTSRTTNGSNSIWGAPLSFVLGGFWYGGSNSVASGGFYWSSVVDDLIVAYLLDFDSDGGVDPQFSGLRYSGLSVRCVAR